MKKTKTFWIFLLIILITFGCKGKGTSRKEADTGSDSLSVPDTGYTGIRKYYSKDILFKEVTFKNSVRQGEMKTYYPGGQLYQTFWYENGLREDTARWYYTEGQVFRATPYLHDTIDGIQKQYYRTGRLKAKIYYRKGFRTPQIEEYTNNGKLIKDYPEILYTITDNYKSSGKIRINLELSDKSKKVRFYRGDLNNGVFDTLKCIRIKPVNGKNYVDLRKTGSTGKDYINIIAVSVTDFGNNYIESKKISLPYIDLN
jgi:hypothetical protein